MTCPKHPRLRGAFRCPCNPPDGERGIHTFYRVNAIRTHDGVIWLETLGDGMWFQALAQQRAHEHFVPGGKPYRPAPVA